MTGGWFRISAALVAIAFFAPQLMADAPNNESVDEEIDRITEPPDYDWLRAPKQSRLRSESRQGRRSLNRGEGRPGKAREKRDARSDGCGYQPEPSEGKLPPEANHPSGSGGCGGGPAPGSGGPGEIKAPPLDTGGGCGSSPETGCGCGNSIGSCGCGDAIGSCDCGALGAVAGPFGYLLAAVALGLIIFLIARAIMAREKRADQSIIAIDGPSDPRAVRISEVSAYPVSTMMERAVQAAARGDYKTAVGWGYLCGISRLHRAGYTALDHSTTNWTIVASTAKKKGPHEAAGRLMRVFEDLFFGAKEPQEEHWRQCSKIVEDELGKETDIEI